MNCLYKKIPSSIITAFRDTGNCLEKLEDFLNDFPLDGEQEVYDIDELYCHRLCLNIKRAYLLLEEIQLDLSEIAKYYNKHFTTDHPLYFQKYIEQYQSLMNDDYTQMLSNISQIVAPTPDGERGDETKNGSQPSTVQQLYLAASALSTLLTDILNLCQKTIDKEEQLKLRPKKCLKMLEEEEQEAMENQQGIIKMCQQMGAAAMPSYKTGDRPLMSEVMKRYKSREEFAAAQLHQFSMSDINLYVVEKVLTESRLQGLTKEEMKWWKEEPEMIRQVRYVIEHLDELDVESKMSNKHLIDVKALNMLMKWAHLAEATTHVSVPQFFRYVRSIYQGRLKLPSTTNYHKYKGKVSAEEYQQFVKKIELLLKEMKQKAIQVTLKTEN